MKFGITAAGRIASAALQVWVLGLVTRAISIAEFGTFAATVAGVSLISSIFDFGMGTSLLRGLNAEHERRSFSTFGIIRLFIAFSVLVYIASLEASAHNSLPIIWAAAFLSLGDATGDLAVGVFQGRGLPAHAVATLIARRIATLMPLLCLTGETAVVVSCVVAGLAGFALFGYQLLSVGLKPSNPFNLLKANIKYMLNSGASNLSTGDTLVVAASLGPQIAGFYSGATRFLGPLNLLVSSLIQVLVPQISSLENPVAKKQAFMKARNVTLGSSLILCLASPLMPLVVEATLGDKYRDAWAVAVAVPLSAALSALSQVYLAWFTATSMPRSVPVLMLVSAVAGLSSIFILGLGFGLSGSAVGMALMQLFFLFSLLTVWNRHK